MLIIFGIAAGCILAERLWPAMELPRVNAWWGRVILINSIQLGITVARRPNLEPLVGACVPSSFAGLLQRLVLSADHLSLFHLCLLLVASVIGMNRSSSGGHCIKFITQLVAWKS